MSERKKLGAYYTPKKLAAAITRLCLVDTRKKVIDPSFGGCAFVEAIAERIHELGSVASLPNVYGCDIDPVAFDHLSKSKQRFNTDNFLDGDFLSLEFDERFDLVIGNPPYIKHDNIPRNARLNAEKILRSHGVDMVKPNYWAYFILRSMDVLSIGGKITFILPQSFYDAEYSIKLLEYLGQRFARIMVFPLKGKIFEGTNESVCIAVLEGYKLGATPGFNISEEMTIEEFVAPSKNFESLFVPATGNTILDRLLSRYKFPRLKELGEIKIGTVTGDKEFFILSNTDIYSYKIPEEYFIPIISNAKDLDKLEQKKDINELPKLLYVTSKYQPNSLYSDSALDNYLNKAPTTATESYHAKHRVPWYTVKLKDPPDAFIKNLSVGRHRIYSNTGNVACTNNILGVHRLKIEPMILEIVSKSSLFALYSSLMSINYGRKANKLDPRHAKEIVIPINDMIHKKIYDIIMRGEHHNLSLEDIDSLIYNALELSNADIKKLKDISQKKFQ